MTLAVSTVQQQPKHITRIDVRRWKWKHLTSVLSVYLATQDASGMINQIRSQGIMEIVFGARNLYIKNICIFLIYTMHT